MPETVAQFWGGIPTVWKVLLAILAIAGTGATFAAETQDFRDLPETVQELEATVGANTSQLRQLRGEADALSGRLDRILCYLESEATGTNPLGCSR